MMKHYKNWDSEKVNFLKGYWKTDSDYRGFMVNEIIKLYHTKPGLKILDAGCGTGYLFKILPENIKEKYTGIDFSPDMITYCKENYPEYEDRFKRVDILDFPSIPFSDLVITQNVLQHITLYQLAMDNLCASTNEAIMLCERTKVKPIKNKGRIPWKPWKKKETMNTEIVGYNPTRWRFNKDDFLECMNYLALEYGFKKPRILGFPRTTQDLENCLAIYYMDKGLT